MHYVFMRNKFCSTYKHVRNHNKIQHFFFLHYLDLFIPIRNYFYLRVFRNIEFELVQVLLFHIDLFNNLLLFKFFLSLQILSFLTVFASAVVPLHKIINFIWNILTSQQWSGQQNPSSLILHRSHNYFKCSNFVGLFIIKSFSKTLAASS